MELPRESDFENLANSREMAGFTRILKNLTGVAMALNAPGVAATRIHLAPSDENGVCTLIKTCPEGIRRCHACNRRYQQRAARSGKPLRYRCHAGFIDMAIPVVVQGQHIATISCGQILPEPPSEAGLRRCRRRLAWLDVPEARLRRAYFHAPYLRPEAVDSVLLLQALFARQLCDSFRHLRELAALGERPEIRRAREYIEAHFRESPLRLSAVAAHAGLSPAHFSQVFHVVTGERFSLFVQKRRLEEAKRLLAGGDDSIVNVAAASGFGCLCHFNRAFKRSEKCSPKAFRAMRSERTKG